MTLDVRPLLEVVPALPLLQVLEGIMEPAGLAVDGLDAAQTVHDAEAAHLLCHLWNRGESPRRDSRNPGESLRIAKTNPESTVNPIIHFISIP